MNPKAISNNLLRLARGLFDAPHEQERFVESLVNPVTLPTALVWLKDRSGPFQPLEAPTWLPEFVDLVEPSSHPGKHTLHNEGAYYCLDPSSVFASRVFLDLPRGIFRVLDMCAAPGGKSVLAYRGLHPQRLIANETIGKRLGALVSNFSRCGLCPATIVSADPKVFAEHSVDTFDLVIVDAPCSGQSLYAKGIASPGCFHPATVNMNSNRQKRILACAASTVAPGGYLAYMTCTYSIAENEKVTRWFMKKFPAFEPVPIAALSSYHSTYSEFPAYRLMPEGIGAGAFAVLLRKEESGSRNEFSSERFRTIWNLESTDSRFGP